MRMSWLHKAVKDERGVAAAVVVLAMLVIVGSVALSVDLGALFADRRGMVNAADSASLAAAEAYALKEASCGTNDGPAKGKADDLATSNVPSAQPDDRPGNSSYIVDCTKGTVTVQYYKDHPYLFAPILGIDSAKVAAKATAAWGPAGGAGGVLPVMLSAGRLSTCDIPGGVNGQDCYFYLDNGPSGYGNAQWALLNVQPTCAQNKYGWDVSVARCSSKVSAPNPTYNCPQFSDSEMRALIANGSPKLSMTPPVTYVCTANGANTPVFRDIQALMGQIRLFPVNDPTKQILKGGILAPPPMTPDFYAVIGFIQMRIVDVWRGNDAGWDAVHCPGPGSNNAWCLHAVWIDFTHVPGVICHECQNFGVQATQLIG